jgi:hypothetical protein
MLVLTSLQPRYFGRGVKNLHILCISLLYTYHGTNLNKNRTIKYGIPAPSSSFNLKFHIQYQFKWADADNSSVR